MTTHRRRTISHPLWWLILLSLWLCQSCTLLAALPVPASQQTLPVQQFRFQDGGHAIYFSLDKQLADWRIGDQAPAIATYVFVISGADCSSMQSLLPQYFRGLEGESGPMRIFVLHKRHIEARTWGRLWGCSNDFIQADHPTRWIADQAEFIRAQLAAANNSQTPASRVAVLGISEGGEIVPQLARAIPAVTHAVILANGGINPLDAYRLQARKHGFTAALAALDVLDRPAPSAPDAVAPRIHGRSWRYWSELRSLRHTESLLALEIPLLVAMGEADQAVPIESAWYLREQFVLHNKSNLTLLTYPGADHALQRERHSHLPDFFHQMDLWLGK